MNAETVQVGLNSLPYRKALLCLWLIILLQAGCQPESGNQPAAVEGVEALSGAWEVSFVNSIGTVEFPDMRFGEVVFRDTSVFYAGASEPFIRDLHPVEGGYEGVRIWPGYKTKTVLKRITLNELVEKSALMPRCRYLRKEPNYADESPVGVDLLSLKEYRIQVGAETISLDSGAVATFERSRTVEHSVEVDATNTLEGSLGFDLGKVKGEIRGKIERRLGRGFKESETSRNSVTLDGRISRKWRLLWYEVGKAGVAKVKSGSLTEEVDFRFPESAEIEVKAIR